LANIILEDTSKDSYAVQISFQNDLLLEYEQYKKFSKTNRMYTHHPENINIPVKAHYHIVGAKNKKEIYAVNGDGTSHHRANKGIIVPPKEADELRKLGVQLGTNNILENINFFDNSMDYEILFLIIN